MFCVKRNFQSGKKLDKMTLHYHQ